MEIYSYYKFKHKFHSICVSIRAIMEDNLMQKHKVKKRIIGQYQLIFSLHNWMYIKNEKNMQMSTSRKLHNSKFL